MARLRAVRQTDRKFVFFSKSLERLREPPSLLYNGCREVYPDRNGIGANLVPKLRKDGFKSPPNPTTLSRAQGKLHLYFASGYERERHTCSSQLGDYFLWSWSFAAFFVSSVPPLISVALKSRKFEISNIEDLYKDTISNWAPIDYYHILSKLPFIKCLIFARWVAVAQSV